MKVRKGSSEEIPLVQDKEQRLRFSGCFADALRVITASRPFPVVGFGSHAFCMWSHLRGPRDVGAGVPPRPNFGIESILLCFLLLTDLLQLQV